MQNRAVYIVDDSQIQVIILKKFLLERGFAVQAFSNGYDLMEELDREKNPPLIISDIDMPGMDGFELMKRVKRKNCCRDIPFFFISSKKDSATVKEAQELGARNLIEKPFNSELLLQLIEDTFTG